MHSRPSMMSLKHSRVLLPGMILSTANATRQGLSFIRAVIVGRLIGQVHTGIGSRFILIVALLEMITNLSPERLMVQARDGNRAWFESTVHALSVTRGLLSGTIIALLAIPGPALLGISDARPALLFIALVPVIRGFAHADFHRYQRILRFGPAISIDIGPSLVATLLVWPLAVWTGDYRVMLAIAIVQAVTHTVISHVTARRPYQLSLSLPLLRRVLAFGWPIVLNGALMYSIFHGDGWLITWSRGYGDAGAYYWALLMAMAPTTVVTSAMSSLLLPLLSEVQENPAVFVLRLARYNQGVSLLATAIAVGFALLGGRLFLLVFGDSFAVAAACVSWLGTAYCVRIMRVCQTVAAMALADTRPIMTCNVFRAVSLPAAFVLVLVEADLVWFPVVSLMAEFLSMAAIGGALWRRHGIQPGITWRPLLLGASIASVAGLLPVSGLTENLWIATLAALTITIAGAAAHLAVFPELRREFFRWAGKTTTDSAS